MSKSIRYYYFTSIATVLVASIMVMGLIQIWTAATYFRQEKEILLGRVVNSITDGAKSGQIGLAGDGVGIVTYMAKTAGASVLVADGEGNILYTTQEQSEELLGAQIPQKIRDKLYALPTYSELGVLGGLYTRNFYTVGSAITGPDGLLMGYVVASSDASGLKVYLTDMMSGFILSAGLVFLLSSVLAIFLTNRTVIPIRRVSEAARQFGEGNYSARVPVEGDDELTQLAITFNDMAKSFEATDRSRRSFMGNIAHELRTPMTTIKGFIDGMLDGTIPEAQQDKYLKIVSSEVGRLARLTKNMLDISRLESGEYTPNISSFDIWSPVVSVFISTEQRLVEKKIEVEGINPDNPVQVLGDADFIHQVLFNLVDNALKFTNEGGKISVEITPNKGMVTVSIRNTGGGIPAETLPYIFDRFYKADKSRGVNAGGSGLGLHICKVLVGLMGGRVWAESEEGAWSCFYFTLPAAPAKKAPPRRGDTKIVVVPPAPPKTE